ncbi:transmembrane amino acid transporter family [Trichoderma arundinaceum]|uniref:Transmembrane amino acid transporter family n=1 Tax=Trichoderma arundinaceum TaxID=490622 RepID=A0A395NF27_TRIAR|nr:transmembrane amino acid transporter family [Trichoderma arundinaceum]
MTMAKKNHGETNSFHDEDRGLLASDPEGDDLGVITSVLKTSRTDFEPEIKTPRTPGRVQFDLTPHILNINDGPPDGRLSTSSSLSSGDRFDFEDGSTSIHDSHRVPLLTDLEAPSVTVAREWDAGDDDEENAAEAELRRPKSGLKSAFMNMANSIIGAGIIGQPYAMRQAGLLAGTVLLIGLTVVVDWTICLIVINSKLSGTSSFQGTVQHCFGRPGLIAISVAQWVFAFGGMVAFGVIVGDTIPHVLTAIWTDLGSVPVLGLLTNRRVAIAVFCMGISYPLTLYRDIAKLAKASTLALIGMLVIVVTVLVQGVLVPSADRGSFSTPLLTINGGIFQAIGVISFAFVCHHNSLLIYGSLKTPTIDNFSRVTHYSTGVSMLACLIMALGGFLTFGDKTLGNVLNNFSSDNSMVNVARLCFGLNMLTTLPLEAFVCREVMITYFYPDEPFDLRRHLILSTALVAGATMLSMLTCDLGIVFELVGATSAVAMAYILPPMCYIKLTTRSWRTYVAVAIVVFGVAVMVISVIQAIDKMINANGDLHHMKAHIQSDGQYTNGSPTPITSRVAKTRKASIPCQPPSTQNTSQQPQSRLTIASPRPLPIRVVSPIPQNSSSRVPRDT